MFTALFTLLAGLVLTGDLVFAWQVTPFFLRIFGPTLLAMGVAAVLHEALPEYGRLVGVLCFVMGLIMLILGVFPWAYTPWIIQDGGMEGSGMLGTLIFILAAPPGLGLFVLGIRWSR